MPAPILLSLVTPFPTIFCTVGFGTALKFIGNSTISMVGSDSASKSYGFWKRAVCWFNAPSNNITKTAAAPKATQGSNGFTTGGVGFMSAIFLIMLSVRSVDNCKPPRFSVIKS